MQPASLNRTGYATLPPDEQGAIRRLLKDVGADTPGNRDRVADLLDDSGSDPFVLAMVTKGAQVVLTVELEEGFMVFPATALNYGGRHVR
jgi:hypothetical protein